MIRYINDSMHERITDSELDGDQASFVKNSRIIEKALATNQLIHTINRSDCRTGNNHTIECTFIFGDFPMSILLDLSSNRICVDLNIRWDKSIDFLINTEFIYGAIFRDIAKDAEDFIKLVEKEMSECQ